MGQRGVAIPFCHVDQGQLIVDVGRIGAALQRRGEVARRAGEVLLDGPQHAAPQPTDRQCRIERQRAVQIGKRFVRAIQALVTDRPVVEAGSTGGHQGHADVGGARRPLEVFLLVSAQREVEVGPECARFQGHRALELAARLAELAGSQQDTTERIVIAGCLWLREAGGFGSGGAVGEVFVAGQVDREAATAQGLRLVQEPACLGLSRGGPFARRLGNSQSGPRRDQVGQVGTNGGPLGRVAGSRLRRQQLFARAPQRFTGCVELSPLSRRYRADTVEKPQLFHQVVHGTCDSTLPRCGKLRLDRFLQTALAGEPVGRASARFESVDRDAEVAVRDADFRFGQCGAGRVQPVAVKCRREDADHRDDHH